MTNKVNANGYRNLYLQLSPEDPTFERIEKYQAKTEIKTSTEAVRQLIKKGYESFEKEQSLLETINN